MVRNKVLGALLVSIITMSSANAIEMVNRQYRSTEAKEANSPNVIVTPVSTARQANQVWAMDAKDVNYFGAFQRWAETAGYQVRWDANKHFIIEAVSTFSGSFEDAVTAVLANPGVAFSKYPLEVCFYPNTPPLARITRKGDQDKECQ